MNSLHKCTAGGSGTHTWCRYRDRDREVATHHILMAGSTTCRQIRTQTHNLRTETHTHTRLSHTHTLPNGARETERARKREKLMVAEAVMLALNIPQAHKGCDQHICPNTHTAARQLEWNRLQPAHTKQGTYIDRERDEERERGSRITQANSLPRMHTQIQRKHTHATRQKQPNEMICLHACCSQIPSNSDLYNCVHLRAWSTCQFILNTCGSGEQSHWSTRVGKHNVAVTPVRNSTWWLRRMLESLTTSELHWICNDLNENMPVS